ncbi:MAG: SRPBCC family protein [Actinomycetota bacterium]|nr:SRPBCC family protein [Actinomycetota bacterium]
MLRRIVGGVVLGSGMAGYVGLVTGRLTLDLGVGRRTRALGPIEVEIRAPRQLVYDVAIAPYSVRATRAMRKKVEVLERSEAMVLAAHRTPVAAGLTAVTVETVRFEPPSLISFRLLRGPVPYVVETFALEELPGATTRLVYSGELGTDLWSAGERWGDVVARSWTAAVQRSLTEITREAERRDGFAG